MTTMQATVKDTLGGVAPPGQRSFFSRKLERHLLEKGVRIPNRIFAVMDTPFCDFTPGCMDFYERKIKGQALFHIFSDMLIEIYENISADRLGWEDAAEFMEDTPMKVCALYTLEKIEEMDKLRERDYLYMVEEFSGLGVGTDEPPRRKFNVKPYTGKDKGRWKK